MPILGIIWAFGKGLLRSPVFLACAAVVVAYLVGYWRGGNSEEAKCEARIEESRREAVKIDTGITVEAYEKMSGQREDALARARGAADELKESENEIAGLSQELQNCRRLNDREWNRLRRPPG